MHVAKGISRVELNLFEREYVRGDEEKFFLDDFVVWRIVDRGSMCVIGNDHFFARISTFGSFKEISVTIG